VFLDPQATGSGERLLLPLGDATGAVRQMIGATIYVLRDLRRDDSVFAHEEVETTFFPLSALLPERDAERAELVGVSLALELAAADHMGVGEADVLDDDRQAELHVADEGFLVDAATVGEGVTVEEDVARHRATVHAAEQIPADAAALALEIA